jgi:hypothetical protein
LKPLLLVAAKSLLLPIVLRLIARVIPRAIDYEDFLFIYGLIPTAPTVHVMALQYALPSASAVGAAVVVGTFLSAPLIFGAVVLTSLSLLSVEADPPLFEVSYVLAAASIIAASILFIFALSARRTLGFRATSLAVLAFCQIGLCALNYTCTIPVCDSNCEQTRSAALFFFQMLSRTAAALAAAAHLLPHAFEDGPRRNRIVAVVAVVSVAAAGTGFLFVGNEGIRTDPDHM